MIFTYFLFAKNTRGENKRSLFFCDSLQLVLFDVNHLSFSFVVIGCCAPLHLLMKILLMCPFQFSFFLLSDMLLTLIPGTHSPKKNLNLSNKKITSLYPYLTFLHLINLPFLSLFFLKTKIKSKKV